MAWDVKIEIENPPKQVRHKNWQMY
jgi:hypothetical protein